MDELRLEFFTSRGWERKVCPQCDRAYWSAGAHELCTEPPCSPYTFLGASPMPRAYTNHEMREAFLGFLEAEGHGRVGRYPIVSRWRDDTYFTIASISCFQPWVINGTIKPPANPLCMSQTSVRFTDLDNVGRTGRHLTMFEMMAHHVFNTAEESYYFTERTAELCHQFLVQTLQVPEELIVYIESWWTGGGNSGPCLEVIVSGVEVATLVFMMYDETEEGRKDMAMKVVDTGYGLERLTWLSQGSTSIYEAVFGAILPRMRKHITLEMDAKVLAHFSERAGMMDIHTPGDLDRLRTQVAEEAGIAKDEFVRQLMPFEDAYMVCDHTRALCFLLTDGVVPSNSKAGYYARILVRRSIRALERLGGGLTIRQIMGWQIDDLGTVFPELEVARPAIDNLIQVEEGKYAETLRKGAGIVKRHAEKITGEVFPVEILLELYTSNGLMPEMVAEVTDLRVEVPDDFFTRASKKGESTKAAKKEITKNYPSFKTRRLYYEDERQLEFTAKVEWIDGDEVILAGTCFYPEGGGQEGDRGHLGDAEVLGVQKVGETIIHRLAAPAPFKVGEEVQGEVAKTRRRQLMAHHTATHIINGAAKEILGAHIWQNGAYKAEDKARIDLTHYESIDFKTIRKIEKRANEIVFAGLPIVKAFIPRGKAEAEHGFSLYQGGVAPGQDLRIVDITGFDVEACGGTHMDNTNEIGPIEIIGSRRIQDGLIRIEFMAGPAAIIYRQQEKAELHETRQELGVTRGQAPQEAVKLRERVKEQAKKLERMATEVSAEALIVVGPAKVRSDALEWNRAELTEAAKSFNSNPLSAVTLASTTDSSFLLARSPDLDWDMKSIFEEVKTDYSEFKVKGGGRPDLVQGQLLGTDPVVFLAAVTETLRKRFGT